MNERAELELEAGSLEPGESIRMVCPFCGGGYDKERSLSLTHREDGTLLYHCYRSKCGAGGALGLPAAIHLGLHRVGEALERKASRVKPNIEDRLRRPEGHGQVWGMYAVDLIQLGVMWDDETQRLALPVYGPNYKLRGRVLRTMPGDTRQPKTLMMMYDDGPTLAWNRMDGDTTVVVEDIPSSLVLRMQGYRSVALNGTHMSDDAVEELARNTTSVIWALDKDAFAKSCKYSVKYRLFFRDSIALLLGCDFKDMRWEEVDACLSGIYLGLCSGAARPTSVSGD